MLVHLAFQLRDNSIPKDNRPCFLSMIKHSIQNYNPNLYQSLYENDNPTIKDFTFSVYLPANNFIGDDILLADNNIYVNFSTGNFATGIEIYNAFLKQKNKCFTLGKNEAKLLSVKIENHMPIQSNEIIIKFLSPLVIRNHVQSNNTDNYLTFEDKDFAQTLYKTVEYQMKKLTGENVEFQIEPINPLKTVTYNFGSKIPCSLGIFKISAKPQDLNMLAQYGIGSRRSEGYGMFQVIRG